MSNTKHYIWSAVGKFGTEILGFIGNVLIARILMPEDYGLVSMVYIVVQLSLRLTDAGFNDGLIRKRDSDKYDFGTIATYNVAIATSLYLIIYFTAPWIAVFFDKPILEKVVRWLALAIILKSLSMSGFVQLSKGLRFKQSSIVGISCSVCSISIIYAMALMGWGFWALVAQPIVIAILNFLLLIFIAKWRPYFCFRWVRFKELFSFSSNLLISYIINTIGSNFYTIIIGKFYSTASLGYYNQAHKMQSVPTHGINAIMLTTSYPIIAKESNPQKRYNLYINLFKQFNFVQTVMVFFLISVADITFLLILGEKWLPSAHLFQLLMLISLSYPLQTINSNIVKIQGRSDIYRNLTLVRSVLQILALLISASFTLEVIIIGQIIAYFISSSIDMFYCGRTIGFTIGKQYMIWLQIVWKPFLALVIGELLSYLTNDFIMSKTIGVVGYLSSLLIIYEITKDEFFYGFKNKIKCLIWKQ